MGRAPCCVKVGLKKGRWTAEEDEILAKYIQANGEGSWRSLPKNAGLLRCGKSCRLRWMNYLRADLKRGNISAEEENSIVKLHASFGNRWSLIASYLPGRTDNEIKNYWNSHLSRKIYSFPKIITTTDDNTPKIAPIPPKRKGGRTSRWAMKKNKIYPRKDTQKPKDSITQQNNEAAVPPPPTPSLERENLMDTDTRREEEVEVNGTYEKNLVDGVKESNDDDILGRCDFEGINDDGSGALCISDMLESYLGETCGVLSLSEERESSNDVGGVDGDNEKGDDDACLNKIESIEGSVNNLSSNGKIGDWSSPMTLELDDNPDCFSARSQVFSTKDNLAQIDDTDNWDWESVIEFDNNNFNNSESDAYDWKHKENLLTWLWEDDDWGSDCKKLGHTDPQIQNDMVAWFLS